MTGGSRGKNVGSLLSGERKIQECKDNIARKQKLIEKLKATIADSERERREAEEAVEKLRERGIEVIVHQILGLPGETAEDMAATARYIGRSGAAGVKFHLLHVLRGTDLAADYLAEKFETMTMEAYIAALEGCVRAIPREMVIHRLTGDGAKKDLIAPLWSGDKKRVLNYLNRVLRG